MPIYEYQCDGCGEVFAVRQKLTDPPPSRHEACGATALHRVLSATSFVLKGTGWYKTDYADKKRPAEQGASAGDKSENKHADGKSEKANAPAEAANGSAAKADAKAEGKAHGGSNKAPPPSSGGKTPKGTKPAA